MLTRWMGLKTSVRYCAIDLLPGHHPGISLRDYPSGLVGT
jgi:hypothetical protein